MTWLRVLACRLRAALASEKRSREFEEELRTHLEMETEANLRRGMSPEEARAAARRQLGGVALTAEACRERRGWPALDSLAQDIRYALRGFRKAPVFTAVVVLSLALGIGANTAIFTLADQVLLRLLPVRNPQELVRFEAPGPGLGMQRDYPNTLSRPMFLNIREKNSVFNGVIAQFGTIVNANINGRVERIRCDVVSGNYYQVLGVRAAAGRLLTPDDDRKRGGHPVAVLSYNFWKTRFGGDPSIVGRTLTLNQTAMTVIGVSQVGFRGLVLDIAPDVTVPIVMKPQMVLWWPGIDNPRQAWLHVFARLKPGIVLKQAEVSLNVLYRALLNDEARYIGNIQEDLRHQFLDRHLKFVPALRGHSGLRSMFDAPLKVLLALVGLVLLIALRQRGWAAERTGGGAPHGIRRPAGVGRGASTAGPSAYGGKPDARAGRRGRWPGAGLGDRPGTHHHAAARRAGRGTLRRP